MISAVNTGFYNLLKLWPESSARNTVYAVGDVIKPTTYASHSYKCTTAGTSHAATEPTWTTTNGNTTVDGTATFTCYDSKTYQVKSPQGSTVPYCTFGLLTESPIGTFADFEAIENLTFWVNIFSDKSTADLAEIADEVMDSLDDKTITATGYTSMKVVREFISSPIWDSETNIYQINLRYRIWLDKS
uniref:Tail protein n=1 Tax=viral metagenome TaxID=1070528 RepID=A0A6M3L8C7_9ZZZZ